LSFLSFASVLDAVVDTLALLSFFVCTRAQQTKNERNNVNGGKERKRKSREGGTRAYSDVLDLEVIHDGARRR
jgi:2-C-methyl-D-erythritol 4-phosphate cytidylyltransferase